MEEQIRELVKASYRHALPIHNLDDDVIELPKNEEDTEWITQAILQLIKEARVDENKTYWWHQQKQAEAEGVSTHALNRIAELKGD